MKSTGSLIFSLRRGGDDMKTKKCYETHRKCNGTTCNFEAQEKVQHAPQLINKLANEYTKNVAHNPDGKIFDHILAMVEGTPDLIRAVNSHEALLEAAKRLHAEGHKQCFGELCYMEKAIAQAEEGK
jgi:hypothetical protein